MVIGHHNHFVNLTLERTSTNTLHTVELYAFYQSGGFDAIFDICNHLIGKIQELIQIKEEDRSPAVKKDLSNAYGAIKMALHFIHPIVSSKPLFESGQTLLLISRDKPDTDLNYFEPHNFLVRLRVAALPLVHSLWMHHGFYKRLLLSVDMLFVPCSKSRMGKMKKPSPIP